MRPLPGLDPGELAHRSGCSGIRNQHWFKADLKLSVFFLGIFPPCVCLSRWRSQSYVAWRRKSGHESKLSLTRKGSSWEGKKAERNFSESELHKNGISKYKRRFKGIFFPVGFFFFLLWDCLTSLTAASFRRALSHIAFLHSCSCLLPTMGTMYFSHCKRCAPHAVLLSLSPLLPFYLTSAKPESTSWYPSLTLAFTYIYEPKRGGEACLFSVSPENEATKPAAGISEAPAYATPVSFLAKVKVWKTPLPSGNALEPRREPHAAFSPFQMSAGLGFKEMKPPLPTHLITWWAELSPGRWDSWSPLSVQGTGFGLLTSHIAETVATRRAIPLLGVLWMKKLLLIFERAEVPEVQAKTPRKRTLLHRGKV